MRKAEKENDMKKIRRLAALLVLLAILAVGLLIRGFTMNWQ